MTNWKPRLEASALPLYVALADAIEKDVLANVLQPGARLPTHRDLADELGINVSTVTRGYAEAERRGMVSSTVGRGTFIAADATTPSTMVSFEPHSPLLLEMGLAAPMSQFDPDLGQTLKQIARRQNPGSLLRYSDPRGLPAHREAGAKLALMYGMQATAEDVVVCAGSQHGLTCALGALFRPGERLATAALTYPGLKALAAMLGIRLCPISSDEQGLRPEALEMACRRGKIHGLYVLPELNNPTTARLPEERREKLAAVARRHDLIVIEDDAYALPIRERLAPLSSLVPERSVFVAGVSKIMGAGLRVAFLCAAEHLRLELAQCVLNSIWMVPPLNAEIMSTWINNGLVEATLEKKQREVELRRELALRVLEGMKLHWRAHGYFMWWELPSPWNGRAFETKARQRGVNVFGAEKFAVGEAQAPPCLRLSLTGAADRDELQKGLAILRTLAEREE